jgi:septal ring factor EnvC (AmiA/AmiB activator)
MTFFYGRIQISCSREKDCSMSSAYVPSSPRRPVSSYARSGKDTNLATANTELTATITSLTATIKNLKEMLLAAATTEEEWNKRVAEVQDLLRENKVEQFLSISRQKELEDLLSRAQNYAQSSASATGNGG